MTSLDADAIVLMLPPLPLQVLRYDDFQRPVVPGDWTSALSVLAANDFWSFLGMLVIERQRDGITARDELCSD